MPNLHPCSDLYGNLHATSFSGSYPCLEGISSAYESRLQQAMYLRPMGRNTHAYGLHHTHCLAINWHWQTRQQLEIYTTKKPPTYYIPPKQCWVILDTENVQEYLGLRDWCVGYARFVSGVRLRLRRDNIRVWKDTAYYFAIATPPDYNSPVPNTLHDT